MSHEIVPTMLIERDGVKGGVRINVSDYNAETMKPYKSDDPSGKIDAKSQAAGGGNLDGDLFDVRKGANGLFFAFENGAPDTAKPISEGFKKEDDLRAHMKTKAGSGQGTEQTG